MAKQKLTGDADLDAYVASGVPPRDQWPTKYRKSPPPHSFNVNEDVLNLVDIARRDPAQFDHLSDDHFTFAGTTRAQVQSILRGNSTPADAEYSRLTETGDTSNEGGDPGFDVPAPEKAPGALARLNQQVASPAMPRPPATPVSMAPQPVAAPMPQAATLPRERPMAQPVDYAPGRDPVRTFDMMDRDYDETENLKQDALNTIHKLRPMADTGNIGPKELHQLKSATHEYHILQSAQDKFLADRDDYAAYRQARLSGKPEAAPASEPGIGGKIVDAGMSFIRGAGNVAEETLRHPIEAGKDINEGVVRFLSSPQRAIESLLFPGQPTLSGQVTGEKPQGGGPASSYVRNLGKSNVESHAAAGMDPNSIGPAVRRGVGEAIVPVGPTLKAGEYVKNAAKVGGFSGGATTVENAANPERGLFEDAPTSAAFGAGVGGILTKLLGKKGVQTGVGEDVGPKAPPKQIPQGQPIIEAGEGNWSAPPKKPLQLEHRPPMEGQAPPTGLPSPQTPSPHQPATTGPSPYRGLMDVLQSGKPLSPQEGAQAIAASKMHKGGGPPPPVPEAYKRESVGVSNNGAPLTKVDSVDPDVSRTSTGDTSKVAKLLNVEPNGAPQPHVPAAATAPAPSPVAKLLNSDAPVASPPVGYQDAVKAEMAKGASMNDAARTVQSKERQLSMFSGRPVKAEPTAPAAKAPVQPATAASTNSVLEKLGKPPIAISKPVVEVGAKQPIASKASKASKQIPAEKPPEVAKAQAKAEVDTRNVISELGDIMSGKKDISQVKSKKESLRNVPKSEALSDKVDYFGEGHPSNVNDIANLQTRSAPRELPKGKSELEAEARPVKNLEAHLKEKGYTVKSREDPIEGTTYDVRDAKGNLKARGDRAAVLNAIQETDAKGVKLASFPGDLSDIKGMWDKVAAKVGSSKDEDIGRIGPAKAETWRDVSRNFKNARMAERSSEAGSEIVNEGIETTRKVNKGFHDAYFKNAGTQDAPRFEPTDYHHYQSLDQPSKDRLHKVLLYGDKIEKSFTPAELKAVGLSDSEMRAYKGVREQLDAAYERNRVEALEKLKDRKTVLTADEMRMLTGKIEGYIPHTWKGEWEIKVNGNKHLKADKSSSFETEGDAMKAAHEIKLKDPSAKVTIEKFVDPTYSRSDSLGESRLLNSLRRRLEATGSYDSKLLDEAFAIKKDIKGFAKHLLERKNAEGFDTQDLDKIIDGYLYSNIRYSEMAKFKRTAEKVLEHSRNTLTAAHYDWLENHVARVVGKPAWDDMLIHKFVGETKLGKWLDPVHGGDGLKKIRDLTNHLNLGLFNVGYAVTNLSNIQTHVWPLLAKQASDMGMGPMAAEKYMLEGVKGVFDKQLMRKLAHEGVVDIQLMAERVPSPMRTGGKQKWDLNEISHVLGKQTEEWSRGVAAISSYKMFKDAGFPEQEALKAAYQFVGDTGANHAVAAKPKVYSGAIGGTLGMYKTYMQTMLENGYIHAAGSLKNPGASIRYVLATVGTAGLFGLPFADDLNEMITEHFGVSPLDKMRETLPRGVTNGLASVVLPRGYEIDLSHKAGAPDILPYDTKSALGPVVSRLVSVIQDVAGGHEGAALKDLVPSSVRPIWDAAVGHSEDKRGRTVYNYSPEEKTVKSFGFTPYGEAEARRITNDNYKKQEHHRGEKQRAMDDAAEGNPEALKHYYELGGKARYLNKATKERSQDAVTRQQGHLDKILRGHVPDRDRS